MDDTSPSCGAGMQNRREQSEVTLSVNAAGRNDATTSTLMQDNSWVYEDLWPFVDGASGSRKMMLTFGR